MLIQNYLTKSEDFVQAVKAHAITKEELKQVCINYKETMEKCEILENVSWDVFILLFLFVIVDG